MCTEGKVDSKRLRVGKLSKADWNNLTNASTRLYDAPIFVDDSAGVSPIEIKAKSPPPEGAPRRAPRPRRRRLPPADGRHDAGREPRPGDLADLALAQADRPRPRRAGARHLAALARRRAAHRQAPGAVRPARVGLDRAGRRPRDVRLPRRLLRRLRATTRAPPSSSSPSTETARSTRSGSPTSAATPKFDNLARGVEQQV